MPCAFWGISNNIEHTKLIILPFKINVCFHFWYKCSDLSLSKDVFDEETTL